jgi:DNA gyrase subunit B/topoisomerase-4 subunit B
MRPFAGQASARLIDSTAHGAGCELFVVEGESAAASVAAVRHPRTQAVLPLQGKPLNAWRASPAKVQAYPLYAQLAQALGWPSAVGIGAAHIASRRFERLCLLFDPDADGIHIGALMLLYLQRFAPALIALGSVCVVRPPMAALRLADPASGEITEPLAYTPEHARALRQQAAQRGDVVMADMVFRGLGSLPPELLRASCVAPATRRADAVTAAQLQAVVEVFGG